MSGYYTGYYVMVPLLLFAALLPWIINVARRRLGLPYPSSADQAKALVRIRVALGIGIGLLIVLVCVYFVVLGHRAG